MQTIVSPDTLPDQGTESLGSDDAKALIALYDRTVDCVKGYATMAEKAEPSFRDKAEQFRDLHARHARNMERILADLGITAEADGTFMGTVNQAVVTFRALFDDIDEDVMDQVRSGEEWVLKAFEQAIAEQGVAASTSKLREMQAELTDLLADTRQLG
jgi:uncharacterized protein (TIGR02284 family)